MGDIKEAIAKVNPKLYSKNGKPVSLLKFKLGYDAPSSSLEPIYFWLLDFMQEPPVNAEIEKIVDNFMASPGSGHFSEIGARATRMQEEGMKILGAINQVIKSVLNLLYDLKEFELRLQHYEDANSDDPKKRENGMLALKQIWMDNVDIKRGRGSINQMTMELGFTTLRDAFMVANSVEDVRKMAGEEKEGEVMSGSINEQVKRILIPRMSEFLKWKKISEKELKKRFEIEKSYLRSQVETIKLYLKWARPYLKAAEKLEQKGFDRNPALVNAFNTAMFELVLFGKKKFNFKNAVESGDLPGGFSKYKLKRDYYQCYLVSLEFRGIPQKVTQHHYGFGGRVDIEFDCYVLNDDELKLINLEMEKQDVEDTFKVFQESTEESLEQLKEDLDHFLIEEKPSLKQEKKQEDTNPFSALFSFLIKKQEKKSEIKTLKDIKKDNFVEKEVRRIAGNKAKSALYKIYDIFKKSHGMASSPEEFSLKTEGETTPGFWEATKSVFEKP